MERWQNKVAVVTGASSGIGAACCRALLAKNMLVVGLARRVELMENELKSMLAEEEQNRFYALKCDVSQELDIISAFTWIETELGGVDVLINCAGCFRKTQIVADNNSEDLRAVVDVNILGVALCTREAFQSMKKRNAAGHVILINSMTGHRVPYMPNFNPNIYPATKYAITAMTEVLRQEFLDNGTQVKVTSISPGVVETDMVPKDIPIELSMLQPEDIAEAVVYCLQTPPHVQVHELSIKPIGELF